MTRRSHLIIVLAVLGLGCESQVKYNLKFVDAADGKPVPGARFEGDLMGHHSNNRLFPAYGREASPESDENGESALELTSGKGLCHYFTIRAPGHLPITGRTLPSQSEWVVFYHLHDTLPSEVDEEKSFSVSPQKQVVIPMRPVTRP